MVLLLVQFFFFIVHVLNSVSSNEKFSTNDKVTWAEFIKWDKIEGLDQVEEAWMKRLKSHDYVEESTVASFQKDVRYCRENLEQYSEDIARDKFEYYAPYYTAAKSWKSCKAGDIKWAYYGPKSITTTSKIPYKKITFFKASNEATWVYIKLPHRMRITGIRVTDNKVHRVTYPYSGIPYKTFKTHISVSYRLYDDDPMEMFIVNGKEKVFQIPQYESEDDEGFGTLTLDPYIVAKTVHIDIKHWRGGTYRKAFHLLGCQDDLGMTNYQYSDVDEDVINTLTSTSDAAKTSSEQVKSAFNLWSSSLHPSYEDGCSIFDFEDGDISGWKSSGGNAFANQPTYGDNKFYREGEDVTGFLGNWWISSYDHHPTPTSVRSVTSKSRLGILTSPKFFISTSKISFLVGGGDESGKVGVEIVVFNQVVAKHYFLKEEKTMKRHVFDVSAYLSKPATLRLVDGSKTSYLMFDDLRTVDRCDDECGVPLGLESGDIPDTYMTSSDTDAESGNPAKHVRFSSSLDSSKFFRILKPAEIDGFTKFRSWLQIKLVHLSLIDGWSTQSVTQMEGKCSIDSYYVMYAQNNAAWRYLSLRNSATNHDTRLLYHHGDKITRNYLNPRITAVQLRFVLVHAKHQHFCFRVELHGCRFYRVNKDNKPEIKPHLLSNKDRLRSSKDTYKLSLVNIPENVARKSKLLTCVSTTSLLYDLSNKFQWHEVIFKSLITLSEKTNELLVQLQESFYKRIFRCQLFQGTKKQKVLFTREFILMESSKKLIVPFVTAEASADIRGGRLVFGDPAVFPVEGQNQFFVSFNLANIIHPYVITQPFAFFCPSSAHYHSPFSDYKKYGPMHSIRDPLKCFDIAIKDGARAMSIKDFSCFGGPGVSSWFEIRPHEEYSSYSNWKYYGCVEIWSYYQKEFGSKCAKSCQKMSSWHGKYDKKFNVPRVEFSQYLYKLHYMSEYKWVEINVKADGVKVFSKKFEIKKLTVGPKEQRIQMYNSGLFPRSRYASEDSDFDTEKPGIRYHDCDDISDTSDNILREGRCAWYVSSYGTFPWGTGSLLTFVYVFRNSYNFPHSRIQIYGQYAHTDGWKKKFSQFIDPRHLATPVIELNSRIGVCHKEYREIVPKIRIHDVRFNAWNTLKYSWKKVIKEETENEKETKVEIQDKITPEGLYYQHNEKLVLFEALQNHSGNYEFSVASPFGNIAAKTRITVYKDYPKITWVTRSPHVVIQGKSDILQIRTNTDAHIKAIHWYHETALVRSSNHFTFIDGGALPHQRKRLLLKNIGDSPLSGNYHVHLVGDYCSFKRTIRVSIDVKPLISITPNTGYKNFLEKNEGDKVLLTAVVLGGSPGVEANSMYWKKDNYRLRSVSGSRLVIQKVRVNKNKWLSTLTITNLKISDEATYSFFASAGKAHAQASKVLYVSDSEVNSKPVRVPSKSAIQSIEGSAASTIAHCFVLEIVVFCAIALSLFLSYV